MIIDSPTLLLPSFIFTRETRQKFDNPTSTNRQFATSSLSNVPSIHFYNPFSRHFLTFYYFSFIFFFHIRSIHSFFEPYNPQLSISFAPLFILLIARPFLLTCEGSPPPPPPPPPPPVREAITREIALANLFLFRGERRENSGEGEAEENRPILHGILPNFRKG